MNKIQLDYLKEIYIGRSVREVANMINEKFGTNYTPSAITNIKYRNGLKSGYQRSVSINDEYLQFLKDNVKGRSNKELTELFNKTFGTNCSETQIASYKRYYKLTSGIDMKFKKGEVRYTTKRPIGSEGTYKGDGVIFVKIGEPDIWVRKNRYVYEQAYGKLQDGYHVIHLNGDKTDFRLENLKAIKNTETLIMGNKDLFSNDPELTKTGVLIAQIINKKSELLRHNTLRR